MTRLERITDTAVPHLLYGTALASARAASSICTAAGTTRRSGSVR